MVWGPASVTADCSDLAKDSRGSQSNPMPQPTSLTQFVVASSASPRDSPLGVSPAAGLEAAAVIALVSACFLLTSVGTVLELYKAGDGPGTDPVFPKASSARPEGQRRAPSCTVQTLSGNL